MERLQFAISNRSINQNLKFKHHSNESSPCGDMKQEAKRASLPYAEGMLRRLHAVKRTSSFMRLGRLHCPSKGRAPLANIGAGTGIYFFETNSKEDIDGRRNTRYQDPLSGRRALHIYEYCLFTARHSDLVSADLYARRI